MMIIRDRKEENDISSSRCQARSGQLRLGVGQDSGDGAVETCYRRGPSGYVADGIHFFVLTNSFLFIFILALYLSLG
jgi:hypothetical protein